VVDKRKRAILRAITDDYIETAEPVGSRTIARKYRLGVSPATIRNEMAELEENGYLAQPHTSAGRIPSDKGYRFYVDALMPQTDVPGEELQRLRSQVEVPMVAIEDVIRRATRILATLTHYAAIAMAPSLVDSVVKAVQFVPIDEAHVLIVVVIAPSFIQNRIVSLTAADHQKLTQAANDVSAYLRGKTIRHVTHGLHTHLADLVPYGILADTLYDMLSSGLANTAVEKVYLEGSINLMDQPEFREIEKAKVLLSVLEERERILDLLSRAGTGTYVAIGTENPAKSMHECSVISATYHVHGREIGSVGLIAPTRMEYTRGIALVEAVAEMISGLLNEMSGYK
jgi:heat-inducible transcriptional repressor